MPQTLVTLHFEASDGARRAVTWTGETPSLELVKAGVRAVADLAHDAGKADRCEPLPVPSDVDSFIGGAVLKGARASIEAPYRTWALSFEPAPMFIASALYRSKLRDGPAMTSREDAARALFEAFPSLMSCETSKAYRDGASWRTAGMDIRPMQRRTLEASN